MQKIILGIFAAVVIGLIGFFLYQEYRMPLTSDMVKKAAGLLEEERYEEAAEQFEAAVINEEARQEKGKAATVTESGVPYITEAFRGLGMAYFSLEDYEQAGKYLQQVIELGGEETPVLYNMLGISAMKLEDYDAALEAFQAGTELPAEAEDYSAVIQEMKWNRIICFEKKLDWNSAKAEMGAYTAAYPEDTSVQKEAEFLSTR